MKKLHSIYAQTGLKNVSTYVQSGNVIFRSDLPEETLVKKLEDALLASEGKYIPVVMRTVRELESVVSHNPFPDANSSRVGVTFFATQVPQDLLKDITIPGREEVVISGREVYIHYPDGMGRSKLKLPQMSQQGTVRNINTITRIAELGRKEQTDC